MLRALPRAAAVTTLRATPTATLLARTSALPTLRAMSSAAENKKPVSAQDFADSDAKLRGDEEFKRLHAKYSKVPSKDRVQRAIKALEANGVEVRLVPDEKAAVDALGAEIRDGDTYSAGGSTTLTQIDFGSYLSKRDKVRNLKGESIAAAQKGDQAKQQQLLYQGALADVFVSSPGAISEDGGLFSVDATGTRHLGWFSAKKLVLVAGTNKLVASQQEAEERLKYQWYLESARVRVAFKVPESSMHTRAGLTNKNPFTKSARVVLVLVEKHLGF